MSAVADKADTFKQSPPIRPPVELSGSAVTRVTAKGDEGHSSNRDSAAMLCSE